MPRRFELSVSMVGAWLVYLHVLGSCQSVVQQTTNGTAVVAVPVLIPAVGKDQRAQAFLGQLDSHPEVGASIDCTSYYELESMGESVVRCLYIGQWVRTLDSGCVRKGLVRGHQLLRAGVNG
jgi:hypothetical protein